MQHVKILTGGFVSHSLLSAFLRTTKNVFRLMRLCHPPDGSTSPKYKNADQFIEAMSLKKVSKGDWTKRLILRLSATVYDPLGLISPFTIRARTILQALWGENLDWETPVPDKYITLWKVWLDELFELPKLIKIPRHIGLMENLKVELHVFVDASTKVFAATVYARILNNKVKTLFTEE